MVEQAPKTKKEEKMLKRREDLEARVQEYVKGTTDLPIQVFSVMAQRGDIGGTTPTEERAGTIIDDRSVKVIIARDDSGCEWTFENDVAVFNNLIRLDNTFNNGFEAVITDKSKENNRKAKEARDHLNMKAEELQLQLKTSAMIINRGIYGFGILKKRKVGDDIVGLVPLDCHQDRCVPIINSMTGELGLTNVNPDDKDMEVALLQKGKVGSYDGEGNLTYIDKKFYFTNDEIIAYPGGDRGKFKGTSAVKRVLRLVEIKKTLENVVEMIVRRYGPQIWVMVGNEHYNLSNTRIPESELRDSDGNPIDLDTARENYKNSIFTKIEDGIQKWAEGETLVQIAEYGIEPVMKTPQTNMFQYSRYIDLFADYIKVGIFGLDVAGRIDVTSAIMQDRLFRDLKDKARKERAIIENIYHRTLSIPILKAKGFSDEIINVVRLQFKPIDKTDFKEDAEMERSRSMTIKNYIDAGVEVPKQLQEKWGINIRERKGMKNENTPSSPSPSSPLQSVNEKTPKGGEKRQ